MGMGIYCLGYKKFLFLLFFRVASMPGLDSGPFFHFFGCSACGGQA